MRRPRVRKDLPLAWLPERALGPGSRQSVTRAPIAMDGYLGDVPALYVRADGRATYPLLAPRLKSLKAFRGDNASHGQLHFLTQGKPLPVRVVGLGGSQECAADHWLQRLVPVPR